MPIRITGLNSGLDTEAIISALMSSYQAKGDKYKKAQTKLSWKQDAWKALNIKINKLHKSASNLRFTSGYSLKKTTVSDPTKATITTSNKAINGSQTLKISKLATSGYLTGAKLEGASASTSMASLLNLADGSTFSGTYRISGNGKSQDLVIDQDTTIGGFVSQINKSGTGVSASYDEASQRLFISSSETGKDGDFTLTALDDGGAKALKALGVNDAQSATANAEATAWLTKYYDSSTGVGDLEKVVKDLKDAKAILASDNPNKPTEEQIEQANKILKENKTIDSSIITKDMDQAAITDLALKLKERVQYFANNYMEVVDPNDPNIKKYQLKEDSEYYVDLTDKDDVKMAANRIEGQDAEIILNDAKFTSSKNQFNINGLSIDAHAVTTEDITITTATDIQGIYDKIKDFLSDYNDVINEMSTLYNAPSAKGYEPLTEEEKEALSDKEVEDWEQKIKDSLLRRDDTLGGLITTMTSAMSSSFDIGGKKLSLASLGIKTLGYFDSNAMDRNSLHIDGDEDDEDTSSKSNKLMEMLNSDPDKVIDLFKQVTSKLYDNLDKKMRSTRLRTAYTVYNDKEMAQSYSDYTKTISKWEEKMQSIEDSYYKKFAAMEKALASINSQSSAFSGFFG